MMVNICISEISCKFEQLHYNSVNIKSQVGELLRYRNVNDQISLLRKGLYADLRALMICSVHTSFKC